MKKPDLSEIETKFVLCKTYGHSWAPTKSLSLMDPGLMQLTMRGTFIDAVRCTGCKTERVGEFSLLTGAQYGQYRYGWPFGFPVVKGVNRRGWRIEHHKRRT